jgi:hypothetical protein
MAEAKIVKPYELIPFLEIHPSPLVHSSQLMNIVLKIDLDAPLPIDPIPPSSIYPLHYD